MLNNNNILTDWMKYYTEPSLNEAFGVLKDLW